MAESSDLTAVLAKIDQLLGRVEALLPPMPVAADFARHPAFLWRRQGSVGYLHPATIDPRLRLADLHVISEQKALLQRNTRQFLAGLPANNALLWGARGTGKSSLIKALLNEYAEQGLRVIELTREQITDLPDIMALVAGQPQRFILFCDDLSFGADDANYQHLKAVLEGSIATTPDNVLIYATSNRRHLMPEYLSENQNTRLVEGEIHHGEAVEEKISLSERFGLWLSFHPFNQDHYLIVVRHWLSHFGETDVNGEAVTRAALQWALERGSRSGRVAWQFAKDWQGRNAC